MAYNKLSAANKEAIMAQGVEVICVDVHKPRSEKQDF